MTRARGDGPDCFSARRTKAQINSWLGGPRLKILVSAIQSRPCPPSPSYFLQSVPRRSPPRGACQNPATLPKLCRSSAGPPREPRRVATGVPADEGGAAGTRGVVSGGVPGARAGFRAAWRVPPTGSSTRDPLGPSPGEGRAAAVNILGLGISGTGRLALPRTSFRIGETDVRPDTTIRASLQARSVSRATQFRGNRSWADGRC
jgi:hypothetical protein